jgi:Uma2 family endonuclease
MAIADETLVLGPEMAGTLMTPEEFDSVEEWDDFYNYELIHGVLVVTPPPTVEETGPNDLLGHLLRCYQDADPRGASLDYTVNEHSIRTPDSRRRADRALWIGLGRTPNVKRDVPSIVVEFVAPGRRSRTRDYEEKRDEYRAAGIAEYWIIDRFRRAMTVYRRLSDQQPETVVQEGQVYATPLLPGFELPLAKLFAEADRLAQAQQRRE